ncbi:MAG: hypothetical protein OK452_08255 [Thaumarchaeota archaeon]|nr:hypothetical protein [Nitrososphaerota archaeon]
MRNLTLAAVLAVVIVASAGVGYLIGVATTKPACDIAPQGSVLYVKVTLDRAKTPATNATVEAVPVETCNGVNTTIAILMQVGSTPLE